MPKVPPRLQKHPTPSAAPGNRASVCRSHMRSLTGILRSARRGQVWRVRRMRRMDTSVTGEDRDPVIVPHTELSVDALRGVVESFVLREGTEYGEREYTLEEKLAHVMHQLERGEARIVFDPQSQTVDIVVTPERKPRSY